MTKKKQKTQQVKNKMGGGGRWLSNHWKHVVVVICVLLFLFGIAFLCWYGGPGSLHKVKFGYESGFYNEDIEVDLSIDWIIVPKLTKIRYTLNGDEPGVSGKVYDGKIKLEVPENGYKVYTITAAYCYFGSKCGDASVGTYVLGKNLSEDADLGIISITASQKDLYSYDTGIMVKGKTYYDNKAAGQTGYIHGNYSQRGEEWIRDIHLTMFDEAGDVVIADQKMGLQISGGTSAALSVKSLKLVGNKKYGYEKIKFNFDDSLGMQKYNSLRLMLGQDYVTGNNVRSGVASRLAVESGFAGHTATKRVIVYLNGKYYGIADVQQNYSDSFLAEKFNLGSSDSIEKNKGGEYGVLEYFGVKELFEADLDEGENRSKLEQKVDMEDYLLYYALRILWNQNTWDWPRNNYEAWRYNGQKISGNEYADGRLRFLIYDVDKMFWETSVDLDASYTLRNLLNGTGQAEDNVFRNVMKSEYYRKKFLSIVEELMAGPFKTEHILEIFDAEVNKIRKQTELHYTAQQYSLWEQQVELMREKILWYDDVLKEDLGELYGR